MTEAPATGAAPSLAAAMFQGLCPRCGARTLFSGPARFAPACRDCGLDFASFNVGDGPAAFLILIVGAIVASGAILLDQIASPLYGLRIGKAALIYQEYRHRAREGRIAK